MKFIVKFETEDGKYSQEFCYRVKYNIKEYSKFYRELNRNSESLANLFNSFQQGVIKNEQK